jgi:hypothetical protein
MPCQQQEVQGQDQTTLVVVVIAAMPALAGSHRVVLTVNHERQLNT